MGQSRKRLGRNGDVRFTAYYDDLGGHRSAGTFPSLKLANKAWQQAEARVAEGRGRKPAPRPRQLFERYVEDVWFPNHVMELTTRQNYTYSLNRHIMPTFAGYRMIDVLPADVREWVATLHATGVKPPAIRYAMTVLSAIFTTAFNDQITFLHPCIGVKTPAIATKRRRIITPDQFGALYDAIPTHELQLLVETDIETGLRWGELIELRVRDIDRDTGVITVSRVAGNSPPSSTPYRAQRRAAGKDSPRQPRRLATDGKGGKIVTIPLAPRTARAVDLAIGERLDGPIFLRPDGQRMDRHCASRIVRRSMAR